MDLKYKIGDELWVPAFDATETSIECPSCGGTGRLRIMFHDDSVESVDCPECGRGYDDPTGRIRCYDRVAKVHFVTVIGVTIENEGVVYKTSRNYSNAEEDLYETEAAAMDAARNMATQYDLAEREKILSREKQGKSWAWHAVYHRRCVKDANRALEYHTKKLKVANLKAKKVPAK